MFWERNISNILLGHCNGATQPQKNQALEINQNINKVPWILNKIKRIPLIKKQNIQNYLSLVLWKDDSIPWKVLSLSFQITLKVAKGIKNNNFLLPLSLGMPSSSKISSATEPALPSSLTRYHKQSTRTWKVWGTMKGGLEIQPPSYINNNHLQGLLPFSWSCLKSKYFLLLLSKQKCNSRGSILLLKFVFRD